MVTLGARMVTGIWIDASPRRSASPANAIGTAAETASESACNRRRSARKGANGDLSRVNEPKHVGTRPEVVFRTLFTGTRTDPSGGANIAGSAANCRSRLAEPLQLHWPNNANITSSSRAAISPEGANNAKCPISKSLDRNSTSELMKSLSASWGCIKKRQSTT